MLIERNVSIKNALNNKTVLLTGAGGGIGFEAAKAFAYMGAYEVFKTAQVELSNTLAMELEDTDIHTYAIGPGLVKTETAMNAIKIVAENMKMSIDEFYKMNSQHILDVENAGVGFALSVLHEEIYHGQEIGAIQVLMEYNLAEEGDDSEENKVYEVVDNTQKEIISNVLQTFEEQYNGWRAMNVFERQWVLRDLKKSMGQSAEQVLEKLKTISDNYNNGNYQSIFCEKEFFEKLKEYWNHQLKLLQGYEKNKNKLQENSQIISGWISDIENLLF